MPNPIRRMCNSKSLLKVCCLGATVFLTACAGGFEEAPSGQLAATTCYDQLDMDRDSGFSQPSCGGGAETASAPSTEVKAANSSQRRVDVNGSLENGMRLAETLRGNGNGAVAVSLYRSLVEKHPDDLRPLLGLAESLQNIGEYREAWRTARQAIALAAEDGRGYTLAGRASLGLREPGEALDYFAMAIERASDQPAAWNGMGVAHQILGQYALAQQAFAEALLLAPDDIEIRSNQAFALALSGDYDKGIYLLGELASSPLAPARVRQNLAVALAMKGDSHSAMRIARMDLEQYRAKNNLAFVSRMAELERQHEIHKAHPLMDTIDPLTVE